MKAGAAETELFRQFVSGEVLLEGGFAYAHCYGGHQVLLPIVLRISYAMSGPDFSSEPVSLRTSYAVPGTDVAYHGISSGNGLGSWGMGELST
eukprot:629366-Rhodomonas_salina.3